MAPFWNGIAIGIAIGIPLFILCVVAGIVLAVWLGIAQGIQSGAFAASWKQGQARAAEIRARGLARNERQRQWLVAHHVPPRIARLLTRSLAG